MKKLLFDFENHGGLEKIYAVPADAATIETDILGYGYLLVPDTTNVIEIPCILDTAKFDEKKETVRQGDKYTVVVSGILKGDSKDNQDLQMKLDSDRWIVVTTDNNGSIRICGDTAKPMQFNKESTTDDGFGKRNQQSFEFSGIQNHSCYYDKPPF